MESNQIALFVKQERKKLKMSQKTFAEYAGVGLPFLRALEQGKTTLKVVNVNKVLRLFNYELGPVAIEKDKQ